MKTVSVTVLRAHFDRVVREADAAGVTITLRGQPIARLVPTRRKFSDFIGTLRDELRIRGDIFSTGVKWDAERRVPVHRKPLSRSRKRL